MAFPTTAVLDNFNRTNEGPPPSASWTGSIKDISTDNLEVISNTLQSGGGDGQAYWDLTTFGPDSEAYTDVPAMTTTAGTWMDLFVRIGGTPPLLTDCYMGELYNVTADSPGYYIFRIDNSASTQLGASIDSSAFSDGDSLGLEALGTAITMYRKPAAGSWASLGSRTDATYGTAGFIGVRVVETAGYELDNFGGGTIIAAGGTLTFRGLKGVGN